MAASEPPDRTASNKENGLDEARTEALSAYVAWLERRPLAARSRQAYGHQVRRYLTWFGDRSRSMATRSPMRPRETGRCGITSGI
jgi:hypothetical protein